MKGDSLVFNASAYRVPEGSTLKALVKQLPGAKVDKEGKITINGKTVSKILLDGKEFFLNDKQVAMDNISTDMIDQIKAYDRKSDLARVTGIDDGQEETVLDLTVKKGMNNGWFGNANIGAGTENRYDTHGMVNRFNDDTQFTILSNARNTPDRWWRGGGGLRTSKEVGGSFATATDKLETGGSLRYSYDGADVKSVSSSENFAAERGAFSEDISSNLSSGGSMNGEMRLEWKPDTMTNIIFRPNMSYSRTRGMSSSKSGSYDEDPKVITDDALSYNDLISQHIGSTNTTDDVLNRLLGIVVNTNTSYGQTYNRNTSVNGELQANRKLNNRGRNLTLRLTANYSEGKDEQLTAANITYNTLGTSQRNNRYYSTPTNNHGMSSQLSYSEPIADRTYLQFSYQYQYSYNKNDRLAQVYESDAYHTLAERLQANRYDVNAVLRFMEQGFGLIKNDSLSQYSEYRYYNQTVGLQLRRVREKYNVSIGLDALPQRTILDYRFMGKEYQTERNVFNFAPHMYMRWNFNKYSDMEVNYNGSTQQPSMTNLLDIRDDSNPLNIRIGNPNLKPSFSNNLTAEYYGYDPESQQGVWAFVDARTTSNSISNKTIFNRETGVRTTMPMNINGNWNAGGGIGFTTGLGKKKLFTTEIDLDGNYSHNVGFYNNVDGDSNVDSDKDHKSITNETSINTGLEGAFRNEKVSVSLRGDLMYGHITNNVNVQGTQNTYDFSYGADLQWTSPWGTEFASDIFMSSRRGYSQNEMNTDELLWNASVAHSFLKGKALTVKAEVFDILGRQTNISRTVNAFMRSDSRTNSINQYGMLSLIYRFSIFAGKNAMGTNNERGERKEWDEWDEGWQ